MKGIANRQKPIVKAREDRHKHHLMPKIIKKQMIKKLFPKKPSQ